MLDLAQGSAREGQGPVDRKLGRLQRPRDHAFPANVAHTLRKQRRADAGRDGRHEAARGQRLQNHVRLRPGLLETQGDLVVKIRVRRCIGKLRVAEGFLSEDQIEALLLK